MHRRWSRSTTGVVLGLGGLLLLVWLIREEDVTELGRRLANLGPALPLALVPYTLTSIADALGWRAVLRAFGMSLPFTRLWLMRLAGEAVNSVAPTGVGGEPVKAVMLRDDGATGSVAAAAVVVSRTALTVTQALLVVIGLGALLTRLGFTLTALLAIGGLLVTAGAFALVLVRAQQRGAAAFFARWIARLLPGRLALRMNSMADTLDARLAAVYEHARLPILIATGWHMLAWLSSAGEAWVVLRLLGVPVPWRDALIIEGLAQPIRATGIVVPGALGTQEGGGVAVCRWLGIPPAVALALWLVRRARETLFDVIGLLYLAARSSGRVTGSGPTSGTTPRPSAVGADA
jgi:glycosyltransferase 2 family protein